MNESDPNLDTILGSFMSESLRDRLASIISGARHDAGQPHAYPPSAGTLPIPLLVLESDQRLLIRGELPGVERGSISVDFFGNKLVVTAAKERPSSNDTILLNTMDFGQFRQELTLPLCVTRRENVTVTFNEGILDILVDKTAEERNRFTVRI